MRNRLRENVKYFVQNLNKIKDWGLDKVRYMFGAEVLAIQ